MESIFEAQISWSAFFKTLIWLFGVFVILKILQRWLSLDKFTSAFWGVRIGEYIKIFVTKLLLVYEPIAVLIITASLLLVDPVRHGLIILVLIIVGFPELKNYINGRILLLGTALGRATRLQTESIKGWVVRWERLGLNLQTDDGLRHIPYSHLVEHGFTLLAGDRLGHQVELDLFKKEGVESSLEKLRGIIAACPYLDRSYRPQLREMPDQVNVNLVLRDEKYLPDLIQVLDEWGWKVE